MTAYRDKLNAGEYAAKAAIEPEPEPATEQPASPAKDKPATTRATTTTRSSATRRRRRG